VLAGAVAHLLGRGHRLTEAGGEGTVSDHVLTRRKL
jgi:hypothetical protein